VSNIVKLVVQKVWSSNIIKDIRNIVYITLRGIILCAVILLIIFNILPRQAYFEYYGEVASIRLNNILTGNRVSGWWHAPDHSKYGGSYVLRLDNNSRITLIGNQRTSIVASAMLPESTLTIQYRSIAGRDIRYDGDVVYVRGERNEIRLTGQSFEIRVLENRSLDFDLLLICRNELQSIFVPLYYSNVDLLISKEIPRMPATAYPNNSSVVVRGVESATINGGAGNNRVQIVGSFEIYDMHTNELVFFADERFDTVVTMYLYRFYANNLYGLRIDVNENTCFGNLNYFYLDSFDAINESGRFKFTQSANMRTHEITNIPIYAAKYTEPLTGQLFFENDAFIVNISGIASELKISTYSLFLSINQWLVDNTLIVAATILSSFIGLLIAQIVKNNKNNSSQVDRSK